MPGSSSRARALSAEYRAMCSAALATFPLLSYSRSSAARSYPKKTVSPMSSRAAFYTGRSLEVAGSPRSSVGVAREMVSRWPSR